MQDTHASLASRPRLIQAVDRALRLLKAVAASTEPPTVPSLARACDLNRSTAWRLLATLEHHGLVERDPASQRYCIGYGVVTLAAAEDHSALVRRSRPVLERLAADTGETINLSIATHAAIVAIDQIDAPQLVSVNWVGRPLPLHSTSVGKLVLAAMSPRELDTFLAHPLEAYTKETITDPDELRGDLERVRERGYAFTIGEHEEGLDGVSAAIVDGRDRHVAFVSVSGPRYRISTEQLDGLGTRVLEAAGEIGERLIDLSPYT